MLRISMCNKCWRVKSGNNFRRLLSRQWKWEHHLITYYCSFQKRANSEVQSQMTFAFFAAIDHLSGLLRTENLNGLRRSVCDLWLGISIRFVCFGVSRFVACDRNYDWQQQKTHLWRRLLNFRVRVFLKSAVIFLVWVTNHATNRWFLTCLSYLQLHALKSL